jgi:hypothetical protein
MSTKSDRQKVAREQATRWAYAAADEGEYLEALAWLRALELLNGTLPHTLVSLRSRCVRAFGVQMGRLTHRKPDTGASQD